jgi:hypothetical protein
MEVIVAVAICVTALLGLQAAMGGAVLSAADSMARRSARVLARGKMEEILLELAPADDSGAFEQNESITYESSVEELPVGLPEGGQTEMIRVVTLQVRFNVEAGEGGSETLKLVSVLPPETQ